MPQLPDQWVYWARIEGVLHSIYPVVEPDHSLLVTDNFSRHFIQSISYIFFFKQITNRCTIAKPHLTNNKLITNRCTISKLHLKSLHNCMHNFTPTPFFFSWIIVFNIIGISKSRNSSINSKTLESRKHSIKHSILYTLKLSKIILMTNFSHCFFYTNHQFLVHSTVSFNTSNIHSKLPARLHSKGCCNNQIIFVINHCSL